MYIKTQDGIGDTDLEHLQELLGLLDGKLLSIVNAAQRSGDPDSDRLFDAGEYFIGIALTAIQQYITSTYGQFKIEKSEALRLPPNITERVTLVAALNAGANFWKHRDEWGIGANVSRDTALLNAQAQHTIKLIEDLTPWDDYTLSNLLTRLTPSGEMRLAELIAPLVKWRDAVDLLNRDIS